MSLPNGAPASLESAPDPTDAEFQDQTPPTTGSSDGEGGERTAREQLKKTSIAGLARSNDVTQNTTSSNEDDKSTATTSTPEQAATHGSIRGRPSKKRSFEDLQKEDGTIENDSLSVSGPAPKKGQHKRMRSREVENDQMSGQYSGKPDDVTSPPLNEESDREAKETPGGPGVLVEADMQEDENCQIIATETDGTQTTTDQDAHTSVEITDATVTTEESPETASKVTPTTQLNPSSGFANTASTSPFGGFKQASPTPAVSVEQSTENKSTSSSAFASSGLSAYAKSDNSPFGNARSTTPMGGFGGGGGSTSSSGFGGFGSSGPLGTGTSTFGSKPSTGFGGSGGFGSSSGFGGGAFGTPKPFGSGLSSFGGIGSTSSTGGFAKGKPFGTTSHDAEEGGSENGEDADNEGQNDDEPAQQDSRFVQQDLETGEEDEETIFTCRAKLYHFDREWKERGAGTFKINIRYESKVLNRDTSADLAKTEKVNGIASDETKDLEGATEEGEEGQFWTTERRARLLMRTDGVHRLVLNTPVFKDMKVGTIDGKEPNGKTMHLSGLDGGKPQGFQIKIGKEDVLRELYHKIQELKAEL